METGLVRVGVFERDLIWKTRVRNALTTAGHEVVESGFDVAVVNLGLPEERLRELAERLRGTPVLAHAGHKESELLELGRELGFEVVSNSTVANKLAEVLESQTGTQPN